MVKADENFRIVNGKLYNRSLSVLWKAQQGTCTKVSSNLLTVQTFRMEPIYEMVANSRYRGDRLSRGGLFAGGAGSATVQPDYSQVQVGEEKIIGKKIILRNYGQTEPATGSVITFAAMQDGTVMRGNEMLELWDCGVVNVVAVVKTNKLKPALPPQKVSTVP